MSDGDWRSLRLRRDDTCAECGTALPAGTTAEWSRARRSTRCAGSGGVPPAGPSPAAFPPDAPAPGTPRTTGTAGRSAQAEYERRTSHRERKVREAHPILGGLVLALSPEPQSVAAWQKGAAGERAVARRLDQLVAEGVEVLHDRRIRGSRANIDHLAVSSSGVYVVDAKNYTGTVQVEGRGGLFGPRRHTLKVGRRDATGLVVGLQQQVELVRSALAGGPGAEGTVPVIGVLTFVGADWPLFPPDSIDGIRLEAPRSTTRLIARSGPYSAFVADIARLLRAAFPEA